MLTKVPPVLSDRYAIERELGRGGMATVYLALDRKHGRPVAIKVLAPELASSLGPERFLREIQIAARLTHPHILPLIESGEAGGLLYYITPHVPGGSLRQRLQREPRFPIADALRITRDVGAALDYAHRQGYVHRDVKPDNILFADGHAVLADFGIARALLAAGSEVVTEVGLALGTPEYMSPEQASGQQDLEGRSDLYSLACVLYEMISGEVPIRGQNARATMAKHITQIPAPLRTLRPELLAGLEQNIARALAKNPDDRFTTVAEFIAALEGAGSDSREVATTTGIRCIAVLPFVNASPDPENEYLSDGITDELIDALARVEGLRVSSRTSVFALKGKPQDVRAIGALLGAQWVLEGTVRRAGDHLRLTAQLTSTADGRLLWSQRYDRTLEDVFAIQEELARTIVETLKATSFAGLTAQLRKRYTENVKAYGLYLRGRFAWNKRTQENITESIGYFEQAIKEDPKYAPAYAGLSDAYAMQLDYRSVPVASGFAHAAEAARQALALDESLAEAHSSLGWTLFIYDWDWESASREFRRALQLDPSYASGHQWYSIFLASRGKLDDAVIESHTALELDPASVSIRRSLGWTYYYSRRYDQARYHLSRAIAMNPVAEETYRVLGLALAQAGEWSEAERVLREGLSLPGTIPYTRSALGYVLGRAGDRPAAEQILRELEAESRSGYVSPVAFATIHIGLDQPDLALQWAEKAYEERRGWLAYLKVNPIVDPLRNEPGFRALVERMKL